MKENVIQITKLLKRLYTINISKYNTYYLDMSIQKRMDKNQHLLIEEYSNFLEQNKKEAVLFSNSLNNYYSDFFRNTLTFSVLERIIFPMLIQHKKRKKKEIRIWSAACASGQEPYSLSLLLEEFKNGKKENFKYRIFATDQCKYQINKAKKGQYTERDLSNLSLKHLKKWFIKHENTYTVKPILKKNISFSIFNLFNEQLNSPPESIFGEFDIIVCANLLFYYNKKHQKKILEKVSNNLAKGGYIITGESERDILIKHNYTEIFPQSAIFQVK